MLALMQRYVNPQSINDVQNFKLVISIAVSDGIAVSGCY